jgi:hypothetical protein
LGSHAPAGNARLYSIYKWQSHGKPESGSVALPLNLPDKNVTGLPFDSFAAPDLFPAFACRWSRLKNDGSFASA